MIPEAVDSAFTIGWAIVAWIVIGAAALTAVVFGVPVLAVCVWRAVRRLTTVAPSGHPDDYREAA